MSELGLQGRRGAWWAQALSLACLLRASLGCSEAQQPTSREPTPPPSGAEASAEAGTESVTEAEPLSCAALEQQGLFERRVTPLVTEGAEPSCARCHLPGVDFRPFVQEDECETLACLQEEGLVQLDDPKASKLLTWIARGHEVINRDLEDDPVARAEHDAFLSWLKYQAQCGELLCEASYDNPCHKLPPPPPPPPPELDMGAPADARPPTELSDMDELDMALDMEPERLDMELPPCSEELIVFQFTQEVWPQHGRCYHCHSDHYSARSHQSPQPTPWMSDDREELGAQVTSERLRSRGYLNLNEPAQSLILLKPLTPELGGLAHGGGTKMITAEDAMYAPLLAWIELLASCQP